MPSTFVLVPMSVDVAPLAKLVRALRKPASEVTFGSAIMRKAERRERFTALQQIADLVSGHPLRSLLLSAFVPLLAIGAQVWDVPNLPLDIESDD